MLTALLFLPLLPQQPAAGLDEVRLAEGRRVATIEGCAPAVCSVMDMKAPGGGSGVIFDPRGFVLTNYHVVGEPDASQPETPAPRLPFPLPGFGQDDGEEIEEPTIPSPDEEQLRAFRQADPARSALDDTALRDAYQAWWQAEFLPRGESHYRHKKVGLPDGELYEAVVLGIDPGSDLAVLRLLPKYEGQRWPWCRLGDSDALLVGETVFAMGNPFLLATDFTPTVTFGIVSGTHRYQEGQGNRMLVYPDCIQVDAPVNPGNSGGPLFNERGEVVGINGRISIGDRGRVNVGVGFAIASNQVRNFLGELMAGRHAEHGTLDMSAWYMNAPGDADMRRGVFVQQIYKDSVVARAGVSLGDELTMFNGQRIRSANQLATMTGVMPSGSWVTLAHRPSLADGGYGDERTVTIEMAALDTGSSSSDAVDEERLASRHDRRIATQALLDRFSAAEPGVAAGVDISLRGPGDRRLRIRRSGDRLRIDLDSLQLVRLADGSCFCVEDGMSGECSVEQRARLDREWAANPMLWSAAERRRQLQDALLAGGGLSFDRPVFRFAHDGQGDLETWVDFAGGAGGYVLRDPIRRVLTEWHLTSGGVRVIVDGQHEPGWVVEHESHGALDDELFRRPR